MSSSPVTTKIPTKIVVKKKRRTTTTTKIASSAAKSINRKVTITTTRTTNKRINVGLPNFQHRLPLDESSAKNQNNNYNNDNMNNANNNNNDDDYAKVDSPEIDHLQDLPSDTWMAIQSLQQEAQGLHIPLVQSHMFVQVILESQIFQRFQDDHASTIWSELRHLIRSNQLRLLSCQRGALSHWQGGTTSGHNTAYIRTEDYIQGVWNAQQYHPHAIPLYESVVSWFVSRLVHWTNVSVLSKEDFQLQWDEESHYNSKDIMSKKNLSLDEAIKYLCTIQILLRDTSNTTTSNQECFLLWLPQWGMVLKQWSEARQQLLGLVARSGEISERNLLNKNRHSTVSTKFLLDELKHQGILRLVQRPFGTFVQKVVIAKETTT